MSHRARKRFGQNFLHDTQIIDQIVQAIHPKPDEHLVEIGPGQGAITFPLLKITGHLDVIELDRDLVAPLAERSKTIGTLNIYNEDALKFPFDTLAETKTLRVVGNLPYNISTPLLFHLLEYAHVISDMYFMLQNEVVDRLAAQPGTRDYGRLSVMMQYYCAVTKLFMIEPTAFKPIPKVNSALVHLAPYKTLPVNAINPETLGRVVKQAFSQRRKTLRNNLRDMVSVTLIEAASIDPGLRAENLSLDDFCRLSDQLEIFEQSNRRSGTSD
jgi:16S rRNA (adenine1518-N6/adenine1519-N6)-dimethyltransferase